MTFRRVAVHTCFVERDLYLAFGQSEGKGCREHTKGERVERRARRKEGRKEKGRVSIEGRRVEGRARRKEGRREKGGRKGKGGGDGGG